MVMVGGGVLVKVVVGVGGIMVGVSVIVMDGVTVKVCEGTGVCVSVGVGWGVRDPKIPDPKRAVMVWNGGGWGVKEPRIPEPNKAVMVKSEVGDADCEEPKKKGNEQASVLNAKPNKTTEIPAFFFINLPFSSILYSKG